MNVGDRVFANCAYGIGIFGNIVSITDKLIIFCGDDGRFYAGRNEDVIILYNNEDDKQ